MLGRELRQLRFLKVGGYNKESKKLLVEGLRRTLRCWGMVFIKTLHLHQVSVWGFSKSGTIFPPKSGRTRTATSDIVQSTNQHRLKNPNVRIPVGYARFSGSVRILRPSPSVGHVRQSSQRGWSGMVGGHLDRRSDEGDLRRWEPRVFVASDSRDEWSRRGSGVT